MVSGIKLLLVVWTVNDNVVNFAVASVTKTKSLIRLALGRHWR
jgi:hypothetical protein